MSLQHYVQDEPTNPPAAGGGFVTLTKALLAQSPIGSALGAIPYLPDAYARNVWRQKMNLFFDLYGSFAEAAETASRCNAVGWNEAALARMLVGEPEEVEARRQRAEILDFQPTHYATMFWLTQVLQAGDQVVDFGGAGGISYELFSHHAKLPAEARWHVVDMPEMIARGMRRHNGSPGLSFGTDLSKAPACDLLLISGCL